MAPSNKEYDDDDNYENARFPERKETPGFCSTSRSAFSLAVACGGAGGPQLAPSQGQMQ